MLTDSSTTEIEFAQCRTNRSNERQGGFSLIEVMVAFIIILVAMLGVVQAFTYAIVYNAGNKTRAKALAVMQQEVEALRSKKFTPAFTDASLAGGTISKTVTTPDGFSFRVTDQIDDEPLVAGVQDDTYVCLTPQGATIDCSIKEITITVQSAPGYSPQGGSNWQSAPPAVTVLRRTRGN
jgi:prepilin-type N-terminal cleavage/methylation domain-containing protein